MNEDYLEELHNLYIEELNNSGVPYGLLEVYNFTSTVNKNPPEK